MLVSGHNPIFITDNAVATFMKCFAEFKLSNIDEESSMKLLNALVYVYFVSIFILNILLTKWTIEAFFPILKNQHLNCKRGTIMPYLK
jgi:hypothetical protein